jgi:creatinine amidohydrolase
MNSGGRIKMHGKRKTWMWEHLTWPELRDRVPSQPVVMLSIASVEDHGPHLPMDVDNFLIRSLCESAGAAIPDEMLLLPHLPYGFETHHMDYPGTIDVQSQHLVDTVADICLSVAHHGFRRILIANGHGSNMPVLDLAARKVNSQSQALCASFIWPSLILDILRSERRSNYPGGMAHACELETALYLHLNGEEVKMDLAKADYNFFPSEFMYHDLVGMGPVNIAPWHSQISKDGVVGDPTLATAESGKRWFDACVRRMCDLVREFRRWEDRPRRDHH